MAIREMDDMVQSGLDRAVEMMTLAAKTSFKFGSRNTIKVISITGSEIEQLAEYCFSLGDMAPLAARDGRFAADLVKEPSAVLLIGDKRQSLFNYNCGACGYRTCAELNKAEMVESLTSNGPSCVFRNINLHMAADAAAAMAWRLGLHCRVFSTLAFAAKALEVMPGVDMIVSIAVSAAKTDPFFDRHKFWTQEVWDQTFKKEFPTFTRGFIGAVEDEDW
ncbi:MAG TPA: DUF2148 domain-containing protein [Deltaproteobacteria bacterium]|nr:DUF2148 domain-containing protein [Deltaproteobacteria bacterium]